MPCHRRTTPLVHAAPAAYVYPGSSRSAFSYVFNNTPATFQQANAFCKAAGAYLVTYLNQAEQADVESYYISNGYLLPSFHKAYWMGLSADGTIVNAAAGKNTRAVPKQVPWQWMDGKVFSQYTYQHWGW
jgi:hypothetical protein